MKKRAVWAIAAAALLLGGAAVAATQVRWGGDLGSPYGGSSVGMPVRVGSAFSAGLATLEAGHRIKIESIRLHNPSRNVVLAGALLYRSGHGGVGTEARFPPTFPRVPMRPAAGAVVAAHTPVELAVGMRATDQGGFRVHGFDVLYRERWHGVDVRRRAHVGPEVDGCAVETSARVPHCRPPHSVD